jgi:hypothetical protein
MGDGRIILRWIFRKWDRREWIGLICLRIGTGGGHLYKVNAVMKYWVP